MALMENIFMNVIHLRCALEKQMSHIATAERLLTTDLHLWLVYNDVDDINRQDKL